MSLVSNLKCLGAMFCLLAVASPAAQAGTLGLLGQVQPTPEPSSLILIGVGAATVFAFAWRKNRRKIQ
ncbi:MAG TPA: PEP-CTERM sorting domain-containing protein [Isosphaeraceae bacterium]|jgi:hypothetical protein|nr:PEP-CTERM sorting domain-containing protein [Isosphaeraceae bacterium]